jgi:hypothetical protein
MGFENSAFPLTSGTAYNHYGARNVGGAAGAEAPSGDGAEREISVNFDGDALPTKVQIPLGAIVIEIVDFFTGTISAATVGAQDISAANGAVANYVTVTTAADLTVTGPTAGTAVVKYLYVV